MNSKDAVYLSGKAAVQYQISTSGSVPLSGLKNPLFGSIAASTALRTLITEPRTNILENEYNRVSKRSIEANEVLTAALASAPALTTVFPTGNSLAAQPNGTTTAGAACISCWVAHLAGRIGQRAAGVAAEPGKLQLHGAQPRFRLNLL